MKIHQQLGKILSEVGAITKNRTNQTQGFKFRGIDDVMNELHDIFSKNNVYIVPEFVEQSFAEKQTKTGGILTHRVAKFMFRFICSEDGSTVQTFAVGEAMDSGDKSLSKCQSIALKYTLMQMFLIPTEDKKDPDAESFDVAPTQHTQSHAPQARNDEPAQKEGCISEKQQKRLFAIAKSKNVPNEVLRNFLKGFGYESSKDIPWGKKYDTICAAIESGNLGGANDPKHEQDDIPWE